MSIAQRATVLDFCIITEKRRTKERHFSIYLESGASYPPPGLLSISNPFPCFISPSSGKIPAPHRLGYCVIDL
jgi:hypothetical protein